MTRRSARARTQGFTLVELMVAVVAGLIAVVTIYALAGGASRHFQEQQRLSQTQTALRLAVEQLRADIERAGFGGTPASRAEHRCANPVAELQAVEFLDDVDSALLPFANVNVVEADALRLVGNFATSGQYLMATTNAAGTLITLQSTWQAFRRDFGVPGDSTSPFDAAGFESAFSRGRVLHVETSGGYHFFPSIDSVTSSGGIELETALPIGTSCLPGLGVGSMVTPLSRVEYRVVDPEDAGLDALVSSNPAAAQLGLNAPVLVRRELPFGSDTPIAGTTRVVLEYVADFHLEFIVDRATGTSAPDLLRVDGDDALDYVGSEASDEPERVRSVILSVSARSPDTDPRFPFVAGRAGRAAPLTRYAVTSTNATAPAARVRTVSTEIFLPNVASRSLR